MGQDKPKEWPKFDNGKWYCVITDVYAGPDPPGDCSNPWNAQAHCCCTGLAINTYIDGGHECDNHFHLCAPGPFEAERIIDIFGPYDTRLLCQAECPPWA